jgi:hypothetical protein
MGTQEFWTRCNKCKGWWLIDKVAIKKCTTCSYITYRCESCGGLNGAWRSILAHIEHWATRGHELGGHTHDALARFRKIIPREALVRTRAEPKKRRPHLVKNVTQLLPTITTASS